VKPLRFLVAVLAFAALAGCYTSDKPLVSEDESVADYAKITFTGKEDDAKPAAFDRVGKHYITTGDDNEKVTLNLKRIDGDYYLAQLSGPGPDGSTQLLYGYLHLDVAKQLGETWLTYGTKDDVQPGLRLCKDAVCIDDLAAYIAYAKKAVDAKAPPDTIFTVTVEQ
jgi:hypothetical protein